MFGSQVRAGLDVASESARLEELVDKSQKARAAGHEMLAEDIARSAEQQSQFVERLTSNGHEQSDVCLGTQAPLQEKVSLRKRFRTCIQKAAVAIKHPMSTTKTGERISGWYADTDRGRRRKLLTSVVGAGVVIISGVVAYKLSQHGSEGTMHMPGSGNPQKLTIEQQRWWDSLPLGQQRAWESSQAHDFTKWAMDFDTANPGLSGSQKLELWNRFFENLPK